MLPRRHSARLVRSPVAFLLVFGDHGAAARTVCHTAVLPYGTLQAIFMEKIAHAFGTSVT
jgi:hypothetical protein